ncbi:type II toxin-antitoxin system VapC family toxin [Aliirhizobium smilacinae]|uniref:Type II toxin-antitoxin system VapC family toxin n=1 Tax=Aliirhizobium smilacinae TaxID=1395944 RepID=A0A5C4XQB0_9HYPH|nr:type II toxin-antitoxin system VapC family toxin [Rhizobium smilacinae]TNM65469.1 type II toxin-antitoxin system VapC family toxin [Rhizobium smilacinae]
MEADRTPITGLVLDASIALVWFLPDEQSLVADAALKLLDGASATVPDLFWHEMRNILMTSYRRKRLSLPEVWHSMLRLDQLNIITAPRSDSKQILTLAERHGLTAYDAAYLALAFETRLPLATLDNQLIAAATQDGVPLLA